MNPINLPKKISFILPSLLAIAFCISTAFFSLKSARLTQRLKGSQQDLQSTDKETESLKNALVNIKKDFDNKEAEYNQLKQEYEVAAADRESLLMQNKGLLQDRDLASQMALNGRHIIEQNYNWQTICHNIADIYRRLLGQ